MSSFDWDFVPKLSEVTAKRRAGITAAALLINSSREIIQQEGKWGKLVIDKIVRDFGLAIRDICTPTGYWSSQLVDEYGYKNGRLPKIADHFYNAKWAGGEAKNMLLSGASYEDLLNHCAKCSQIHYITPEEHRRLDPYQQDPNLGGRAEEHYRLAGVTLINSPPQRSPTDFYKFSVDGWGGVFDNVFEAAQKTEIDVDELRELAKSNAKKNEWVKSWKK